MAAAASPSPFAQLFRRSKFASFDPSIAQVYTTYGGHAHRGAWGLKRPLPLRARTGAYITVSAVDSRAQQTEWNSAQRQARWIKRWEEMGVDAEPPFERTPWGNEVGTLERIEWRVDSEFCPEEQGDVQESHNPAVPNVERMSDREFESYLRRLRALRPAFQQYVRENPRTEADRTTPLFDLAQRPGLSAYHERFLAAHASQALNSPDSRLIEKRPHRTGALSYAKPTPLETLYTTKPARGFVLQKQRMPTRAEDEEVFLAGVGGLTAHLPLRAAGRLRPLYQETPEGVRIEKEGAEGEFRVMRARLAQVPNVVGAVRQGLNATSLRVDVRPTAGVSEFGRENPHPPGSRAYVALENVGKVEGDKGRYTVMGFDEKRRKGRKMMDRALVEGRGRRQDTDSRKLINTLQGIVNRKGGDDTL